MDRYGYGSELREDDEGEEEEEEEDEVDEEEDEDEEGGGKPNMLAFLLGNVDEKGSLEEEYLDEVSRGGLPLALPTPVQQVLPRCCRFGPDESPCCARFSG